MKRTKGFGILAAAALLACASAGFAASPSLTDDGLETVKVRDIDKAYKRPGASLAGYDSILLKPVSVAFSKSWDPRDYGGTRSGLKTAQVTKIRTELAKLAEESFRRTLTRGGYKVVTEPGAGVLEVDASIVDLFLNAPDVDPMPMERTYAMSVGDMRINAELRDAVTGTLLYRVSDKKRGEDYGRLEWANNVWNDAELERMLTGWANQLKKSLDAARKP
jgi:hypothetical protein